ncbi:MAG TPA: ATPase [Capillibacterium sp.]
MGSSHLLMLLSRLEELVGKSPRFAGRVLLPFDEALEIIKKIQATLPPTVKEAEDIVRKKEEIIGEAQAEANRIRERSTAEAKRLLSEHHLTKLAQEKSNEIKAQAYNYAQQVEKEANRYVLDVLGRLEENLLQAIKVVHRAKEEYGPAEGKAENDKKNNDDEE